MNKNAILSDLLLCREVIHYQMYSDDPIKNGEYLFNLNRTFDLNDFMTALTSSEPIKFQMVDIKEAKDFRFQVHDGWYVAVASFVHNPPLDLISFRVKISHE